MEISKKPSATIARMDKKYEKPIQFSVRGLLILMAAVATLLAGCRAIQWLLEQSIRDG